MMNRFELQRLIIEERRCEARRALGLAQSLILNQKTSKGFTLIELIVVIIIIVVLAGIFLSRVPLYQAQAEKAAMQQVEGALQSALVLRYGALMTRGAANEQELSILATDNPVKWLQKLPPNYKGEYYDPSPQSVAPGSWMFDLKSRELIYVVDHSEYLKPGKDGKNWIRFHVHTDYEQMLGRPESGKELVSALFEPIEPYRWVE
ncbi:MAG: prepilin-type N-terminal cleavage/methylation domain-containing protein [Sideroxydans sp.]|jgi:prepilin-type N-terminal cleavage/methylation domain-containing protein